MLITVIKEFNEITQTTYWSKLKLVQADDESKELFYHRLIAVLPNVPESIMKEAANIGWMVITIDDINRYDSEGDLQWDLEDVFSRMTNLNLN